MNRSIDVLWDHCVPLEDFKEKFDAVLVRDVKGAEEEVKKQVTVAQNYLDYYNSQGRLHRWWNRYEAERYRKVLEKKETLKDLPMHKLKLVEWRKHMDDPLVMDGAVYLFWVNHYAYVKRDYNVYIKNCPASWRIDNRYKYMPSSWRVVPVDSSRDLRTIIDSPMDLRTIMDSSSDLRRACLFYVLFMHDFQVIDVQISNEHAIEEIVGYREVGPDDPIFPYKLAAEYKTVWMQDETYILQKVDQITYVVRGAEQNKNIVNAQKGKHVSLLLTHIQQYKLLQDNGKCVIEVPSIDWMTPVEEVSSLFHRVTK